MTTFDADGVAVESMGDPALDQPVLIEGLPGVGSVGPLVADELHAAGEVTLVRRIVSEHLPPEVTIEDGVGRLAAIDIHAVTIEGRDLLVATAQGQPTTRRGFVDVGEAILDVADSFGVQTTYTIGGVAVTSNDGEPGVMATASEAGLLDPLSETAVEVRPNEPAGGVVGISGMLLGLGGRRGHPVTCLIGETDGSSIDHASASRVLAVLADIIDITVEPIELEPPAQFTDVNAKAPDTGQDDGDNDLRYIR